ncbi:MAG: glutamate--cysteine ligase [Chlamydiae bacterium]|nr:glutamate--cysteine ligase [Chlamydiota bacterium]MBI3278065.1 glutamate--cysteine ligase [Chlamydiota bacterium]
MENSCLTHSKVTDDTYLLNYFHQFVKKEPVSLLTGIESELLGVDQETGEAISYEGDRGVEKVFYELISRFSWEPILENGKPIALKRGRAEIHLEPGGQLELSGTPARFLDEVKLELEEHYQELKESSLKYRIAWLELGMQPFSPLNEIAWVPKGRYKIMREYLIRKGPLSHRMMKQTATLQANFDFTGEEDAMEKLKVGMALSPLTVALFANSPFLEGKVPGPLSLRALGWQGTDPDRCGLIREVLEGPPKFESYLSYLLKVPMMFILRDEKWIPLENITWGQFLKEGFQGIFATEEDWELFLTSVFPEARLNPFVELRSADRNSLAVSMGLLAFWKGILLDSIARKSAWDLVSEGTIDDRKRWLHDAALLGLKAYIGGVKMSNLASLLVQYAQQGLRRLRDQALSNEKEIQYLEVVKEIIQEGHSPAERLLIHWQGSWNQNPLKLIEYCRI